MATINDVSIFDNGKKIASAATGELAPPPAANLTLENAGWHVPEALMNGYLQKTCEVTATAAGKPWKGTFIITGIVLPRTIKLTAKK
jgi:hypothetical protein